MQSKQTAFLSNSCNMTLPDVITNAKPGEQIQLQTKICFDPQLLDQQHKSSLQDPWVNAIATKGEGCWTLEFEFGELLEIIVDDDDEAKSVVSQNLWDAGWYRYPCYVDITQGCNLQDKNASQITNNLTDPYSLGGMDQQIEVANAGGSFFPSYQLFTEVLYEKYSMRPNDIVCVAEDANEYHVFLFVATPITDREVDESVDKHLAIFFNTNTQRVEIVSLSAVTKVQETVGVEFNEEFVKNATAQFLAHSTFIEFGCQVTEKTQVIANEEGKPDREVSGTVEDRRDFGNIKERLRPQETRIRSIKVSDKNNNKPAKNQVMKESKSGSARGKRGVPSKAESRPKNLKPNTSGKVAESTSKVRRSTTDSMCGTNDDTAVQQEMLQLLRSISKAMSSKPEEQPAADTNSARRPLQDISNSMAFSGSLFPNAFLANPAMMPSSSTPAMWPQAPWLSAQPNPLALMPQGTQYLAMQPQDSEAVKAMKLMCYMNFMNSMK